MGKRSVEHLQQGFAEALEALARGVIGGHAGVVILHGAEVSRNGQDFTVTAGAAFYQGEIYLVPAAAFTAPAGQVGVWKVREVFAGGDPVMFTDFQLRNVHAVRTLELEAGAAGSGVADYADVKTYLGLLGLDRFALAEQAEPMLLSYDHGSDYGSWPAAKYRRDSLGTVHLSGVRNLQPFGVFPLTTVRIATLPLGFRPAEVVMFLSRSLDGQLYRILVHPDGEVRLTMETAVDNQTEVRISLSGMSFQVVS